MTAWPGKPPAAPEQPLELWDFQADILREIQESLRTVRSLLTTAPTGSGKTVIIAEIMARALRMRNRSALLVHRQELVLQSVDKIARQSGQQPGVVWQGRREWDAPTLVLAQNTVAGLELPPGIRGIPLLIVDEAHHSVAPTWLDLIREINPRYLLGFSATPFRQDREPLCPEPFAKVIRPVTPHDLIQREVLCPALIESPVVHDQDGQIQPVNQAKNLEHIYSQAVRYALAQGRSRIVLYVSSTHQYTPLEIVHRTTRALQAQGITASAVAEDLSTSQRQTALALFSNAPGAAVLVNYATLTEGTDLPRIDCVIIGRHTDSENTIIQMIGRGLRKHPDKRDCLVLDYTGRPDMDDIIHYWRLDGLKESRNRAKRKRAPGLSRDELMELATEFPNQLSPMDTTRTRYPWFSPFPGRPLLALALWSGRDSPAGYVTVEPARNGDWRVSKVSLHNKGPAPVHRNQTTATSAQDAARLVRMAIGEHAPLMERNAEWRLREPSDAQKRAWLSLYPGMPGVAEKLTAGEASDAIAQKRFQSRVNPRLL